MIGATELNCCKRIVHLCRDCLLIVYQVIDLLNDDDVDDDDDDDDDDNNGPLDRPFVPRLPAHRLPGID